MSLPTASHWLPGERLADTLTRHGVSRRDFLEYCGSLCIVLGVGKSEAPRMMRALLAAQRPPVIWLQLQECTGCVESVLRSADPTIGDLVLDLISLDYQHTLMAGAGAAVESAMQDSMKANAGKYILLVTGSIPTKDGGIYCTVGGRTAQDILEEGAKGAAAVVAIGACAHWGSVQAARPNPTGAVGVSEIIKDKPVVNIAG
jgi:hydrogenase small subunit